MKESSPESDHDMHGPAPIMEGGYNLVDQTHMAKVSPFWYWFRMDT